MESLESKKPRKTTETNFIRNKTNVKTKIEKEWHNVAIGCALKVEWSTI